MKVITAVVVYAVAFVALLTVSASFASDWTGKYVTEDTYGEPMTITLTNDGKAAGAKQGIALMGT